MAEEPDAKRAKLLEGEKRKFYLCARFCKRMPRIAIQKAVERSVDVKQGSQYCLTLQVQYYIRLSDCIKPSKV